MRTRFNYSIFLLLLLVFSSSCNDASSLTFLKLSCDQYTNPLGIDNPAPAFSWIIEPGVANISQSAYRIIVSSSPDKLAKEAGDVWDSGKVLSDASVFNKYDGLPLQPKKRYWWKVMIWDQDGNSSRWSPIQFFEMGFMENQDWKGAGYLVLNTDNRESEYRFREAQTQRMPEAKIVTSFPVGYFRKLFQAEAEIEEARIYLSALGVYELTINGDIISDHLLDPSSSSYDEMALYVVHDITEIIRRGSNAIGIILGNGFYGQNIAFNSPHFAYGLPAVKALLTIKYRNGEVKNVITDESWKVNTGPIVFDNVYAGETYDARFEHDGWDLSDFDDVAWFPATLVDPVVGKLVSQLMPPMRNIAELSPVEIFQGANGNWIVDFGQNISGWVKIQVREPKGSQIKITLAEALTRKGDEIHNGSVGKFATGVLQEDLYICKGVGTEIWEPRFTYHGFQFVEIEGLSEKPGKDDLKAIMVCTDLEVTGHFESSCELLNQMVEVSQWTVLGNAHGFPEDCPHREKCGWLGDAQVVAEFCLYHFDIASFYDKFMLDIRSNMVTARGKNTDRTFTVPTMVAPGKRKIGAAHLDWGIAAVYLPWYTYLHTGDFSTIERHYHEMKELVAYYLTFKNDNGIIENGLGDWCPPFWQMPWDTENMECHPFISANAYFYDILGIMQRIASDMDEPVYAEFLNNEQVQTRNNFNRQFLEPIGPGNGKWYGSQTATVLAIQFGMVDESILSDVKDGLIYDIVHNKGTHHSTGIHGNRYIYSVLADLGEFQLSYDLLTTPDFPSQAYILNSGLTTWPERQWAWSSGIEWDRSLNHPMQGGFNAFHYETVLGIRPLTEYPGYKKFLIKPAFIGDLDYAKGSVKTPYGVIHVQWERQDKDILLNVQVPFNSIGFLDLPYEVELITDDGIEKVALVTGPLQLQNNRFKLITGNNTIRVRL